MKKKDMLKLINHLNDEDEINIEVTWVACEGGKYEEFINLNATLYFSTLDEPGYLCAKSEMEASTYVPLTLNIGSVND